MEGGRKFAFSLTTVMVVSYGTPVLPTVLVLQWQFRWRDVHILPATCTCQWFVRSYEFVCCLK